MRTVRLLLPAVLLASTLHAQSTAQQGSSSTFFKPTHPFGLTPNMSELEMRFTTQLVPTGLPGIFETQSVPQPWPSLIGTYIMEFSPKRGLCKLVGAAGPTGDEAWLRQRFNWIRTNLAAIYGNPKNYAGYEAGATLTDPKQWTQAIAKREAVHSAAWLREDGANLPTGIDGIILDIQGPSHEKLIIVAQFYFGSERQCDEERRGVR